MNVNWKKFDWIFDILGRKKQFLSSFCLSYELKFWKRIREKSRKRLMSVISLRLPNDFLFTANFSFPNYKVNAMREPHYNFQFCFHCLNHSKFASFIYFYLLYLELRELIWHLICIFWVWVLNIKFCIINTALPADSYKFRQTLKLF